MLKYFIQLTAVIMTVIFGFSGTSYSAGLDHTAAKQAILIDADTGVVLFEKNADQEIQDVCANKFQGA